MYRTHRNHFVLGSELRPKLGKPQICLPHSVCFLLLFACQDESSAPTLDELGISEVLGEGEGDTPSVPTTPPKGTPGFVQTCNDQRQYTSCKGCQGLIRSLVQCHIWQHRLLSGMDHVVCILC